MVINLINERIDVFAYTLSFHITSLYLILQAREVRKGKPNCKFSRTMRFDSVDIISVLYIKLLRIDIRLFYIYCHSRWYVVFLNLERDREIPQYKLVHDYSNYHTPPRFYSNLLFNQIFNRNKICISV